MLDPHQKLRDDIRLLGALLGEILCEQEGVEFFQDVEWVRQLSKSTHRERVENLETLAARLHEFDSHEAGRMARAFSHFLQLANVAEQYHRVRRRRDYARESTAPQQGSFRELFQSLMGRRIPREKILTTLSQTTVELVFTAHPTEVTRRTLLRKWQRISQELSLRDGILSPREEQESRGRLKQEILSIWLTDEVHRARPTPFEEAEAGLIYFEQTLWEAIPRLLSDLEDAVMEFFPENDLGEICPIRFGSWMGGDRDGNPYVTSEVTVSVCHLARWHAAKLYFAEVDQLRDELSFEVCSEELKQRASGEREPYRAILKRIRARLVATENYFLKRKTDKSILPNQDVLWSRDEILPDLELIDRSLRAVGAERIAEGRLKRLLQRLRVFDLTLVQLDVRQDSRIHRKAMEYCFQSWGWGSFAQLSEKERIERFNRFWNSQMPQVQTGLELPATDDPEVEELFRTLKTLARIPRNSLRSYIISMAESASDVLSVELLLAVAGMRNLPVLPLFETVSDLQNADSVVELLFKDSEFLRRCGSDVEIMLGYSDSAKDAGRFSSAWSLYCAQERLVKLCQQHGARVSFFHGRGGTVGRGGGPTYLAILSQPPGSIQGRMRVTEQGEVIQSKFGSLEIAERSLELYVTATVRAQLLPMKQPSQRWRQCIEQMASQSRHVYQQLVREDPDFWPIFQKLTPVGELPLLNVGSRPAKRKASDSIDSLRAIPWVFAWTQNRMLVPSWYGFFDAVASLAPEDRKELSVMYQDWRFFRSTIDLYEMVLAKASLDVSRWYVSLVDGGRNSQAGLSFFEKLEQRFSKTVACVLEISQHHELLEDNPVLRRSIQLRNPYVDPINLLQVELLRRIRAGDQSSATVDAFVIAVKGIAAGMRNTG